MILRRLAAIAVVAAGITAATVVPAGAWEQEFGASAQFVRAVAGPGAATVQFTYTCNSDVSPANHLFVALKQGALVDTEEHSTSQYADSFYDTNWKSDAGPNALLCDGVQHLKTVVLKTDSFWAANGGAAKPLHAGQALVQICLFANMVGDPEDPNGTSDIAFDYTMQHVVAGR